MVSVTSLAQQKDLKNAKMLDKIFYAKIIVLRSSRMFWLFLTKNVAVGRKSLNRYSLFEVGKSFHSKKIFKFSKLFSSKKCKQEQRLLIRRRKLEIQLFSFNVKSTTTLGSFTEHSNVGRSLSCTHTRVKESVCANVRVCERDRVCVCVKRTGWERRERHRHIWSSSFLLQLTFEVRRWRRGGGL